MKGIYVLFSLLVIVYLNNASWIRGKPKGDLRLLAHRGVHQTYSKEDQSNDECTAIKIDPPQHQYLENTIESIQRSFSLGAEIVEIDIHPTEDHDFAVFHDWTLDCRTNGKGVTRDYSLTYLKSLDIGYGYTHDGGKTFPFRGKGVGKIPSLNEVLDKFPEQIFLVNIKSNTESDADLIDKYLAKRGGEDHARLWFYGGNKPTSRLLSLRSELKGFTKTSVKKCAIDYQLIAWTGYVPKSCRNTVIAVPKNYVSYIWGWPRLFVKRMEKVNTSVILVNLSYGHTDGIDDPKEIQALSENYSGIVWTDKIEQVGSKKSFE